MALQDRGPTLTKTQTAIAAWSPAQQTPALQVVGAGKSVNTQLKGQTIVRSAPLVHPSASVPITVPSSSGWFGLYPRTYEDLPPEFIPYGATLVLLFANSTNIAGFSLQSVFPPTNAVAIPITATPVPQYNVSVSEIKFPRLTGEENIGNMPNTTKPSRYGFSFRNFTEVLNLGGVVRHLRLGAGLTYEEVGLIPDQSMLVDGPIVNGKQSQTAYWASQLSALSKFQDNIRSNAMTITYSAKSLAESHSAFSVPADQSKYASFEQGMIAVDVSHPSDPIKGHKGSEKTGFVAGLPGMPAYMRRHKAKKHVQLPPVVGWSATVNNEFNWDGELPDGGHWKIPKGTVRIKSISYDKDVFNLHLVIVGSGGTAIPIPVPQFVWNLWDAKELIISDHGQVPDAVVNYTPPAEMNHRYTPGAGAKVEQTAEWFDGMSATLAAKVAEDFNRPAMSIHAILIEPQGTYTTTTSSSDGAATGPSSDATNGYELTVQRQNQTRYDPSSILSSLASDQPTADSKTVNAIRDAGQDVESFLHKTSEVISLVGQTAKKIGQAAMIAAPYVLGALKWFGL